MKKPLFALVICAFSCQFSFSEIVYGESGLFALGSGSTAVKKTVKPVQASLTVCPNPFNPSTTIRVSMPGTVKIRIFDPSGRLVASGVAEKGAYVWNAGNQASGIYLVKAVSRNRSVTARMMLIR